MLVGKLLVKDFFKEIMFVVEVLEMKRLVDVVLVVIRLLLGEFDIDGFLGELDVEGWIVEDELVFKVFDFLVCMDRLF